MELLYPAIGFLIFAVVLNVLFSAFTTFTKGTRKSKLQYQYKRKQFFLTRSERDCYNALVTAVGAEYYIFAQVHLPTILDHTVRGQNWRGAFAHINRKSVDFVLCDKAYISPKLAIELDDNSHERPDRKERDGQVERILRNADVPLLRIKNNGTFNTAELAGQIKEAIGRN